MSKMKKIVATMLCAMMIFMSMSTLCLATEAAEENQPNIEYKLNSRIVFEGETYWNIGCTRKRNEYPNGKSAVVWAVHKNKEVLLTDFLEYVFKDFDKIDIYDLQQLLQEEYGLHFSKESLAEHIKRSSLYYSVTTMDIVYRDYNTYLEEI